jgi:osmotically-inducible protein OsmY
MIKSDNQLQREVLAELAWDPAIDQETVSVQVHDGIVSVTGKPKTYAMQAAALEAARRVAGPHVVDAQEVQLPQNMWRNDHDLAYAVRSVLDWHVTLGDLSVSVSVADGWVSLGGSVDWMFQKAQVERAIQNVRGIRGVSDHIEVRRQVSPMDVQHRIELALQRNVELNADHIQVDAHDGTVTLRGRVRSWIERQCAERAAWSAPGVSDVLDELIIA